MLVDEFSPEQHSPTLLSLWAHDVQKRRGEVHSFDASGMHIQTDQKQPTTREHMSIG